MDTYSSLELLGFFLALPLIIILIVLTAKYGKKYTNKMTNGRIIRIVERIPLNQTTYMAVVLINDEPYVISGGEKGVEILLKLDDSVTDKLSDTDLNINMGMFKKLSYFKKGKGQDEKKY